MSAIGVSPIADTQPPELRPPFLSDNMNHYLSRMRPGHQEKKLSLLTVESHSLR
jgi:hypothetical protein